MRFDLLIKGGEVVDPGGGHEGPLDVAITHDRIAAVDSAIPSEAMNRSADRPTTDASYCRGTLDRWRARTCSRGALSRR